MMDIKGKPAAFLASSDGNVSDIVDVSRILSKGPEFVLVLKNDKGILKRLLPAYINARLRQEESEMKASTMQMEILLFVAGTLRTDKAIEECGIRDAGKFLVFASSKETARKFAKGAWTRLIREHKLELDPDYAAVVASTGLLEY